MTYTNAHWQVTTPAELDERLRRDLDEDVMLVDLMFIKRVGKQNEIPTMVAVPAKVFQEWLKGKGQ